MAQIVWTEPALSDLDTIAGYIALDDFRAASEFVSKVFDCVQRLEHYPNSGKRPPELPHTPYREVIVPPSRVFYRVNEESVYILHIVRSERQLRTHLLTLRDPSQ